ncbi:hypothetical protein JCM18899A_04990 [Nocardioides sp. AN3]
MWGYVLSIAISLVVFAAELAPADGVPGFRWSESASTFMALILVGALPAALLGTVGAVAVHGMTWRTTAQRWHVLAAAVVGLVAGGIVSGGSAWWGMALGVATGAGRLAVVPLVMRKTSGNSD